MRIGVVSDAHLNTEAIEACVKLAGEVACWLFLGDIFLDAERLAKVVSVPVYFVWGNCDMRRGPEFEENVFPEPQTEGALERVLDIGGTRIFMCHGHYKHYASRPFDLSYKAESLGCSAALFGHTHVPMLEYCGGVLLLNPGSPSLPREGKAPSFAVMTVENGRVNAEMIPLK